MAEKHKFKNNLQFVDLISNCKFVKIVNFEIQEKYRREYKYVFVVVNPGPCISLTPQHLYIMRNTEDLGSEIFLLVYSTGE